MTHTTPSQKWTRRQLLTTAASAGVAGLIYCFARFCPELMFPWYQSFSARLLNLWADLTDLLPFSILEWGIFAAVWLVLGWTLRLIITKKSPVRLICTGLEIASVIILLFVALWGADQFAPTFLSTTEYTETAFTPEVAEAAAEYYLAMANEYAEIVPRTQDGAADFGSFHEIAADVELGYQWLEQAYGTRFKIGDVNPKPMAFSYLMDCIGLSGIYTAYTGEMSINANTPVQSLPYVISHECAHRTTVTQENDANFVAFLACVHSGSSLYQYSGWYSAFIYVYNAIAKTDKDAQSRIWAKVGDPLKADILAANAHYKQFEKPVKQVAQKVNDGYLKSFNQPTGVNNYGAVAGPLIAWYLAEVAEVSTNIK